MTQTVDVTLWGGLVPLAEGEKVVRVEARTIRDVLRELVARYPGLEEPIKSEVAVAVNGTIYRNDWSRPIPEGAEVFLMRRLAGG